MRMEIVVPQTAVNVSPGVVTRVRIQVANTGDTAVPVRIGLARGRLSSWAQAEPSVVSAGPGESTSVDLVFRPPATAQPASTLQPFTVQAEDLRDGSVAARATGLLAVAAPELLTADLAPVRKRRRTVELRLTLTNAADAATTVRVRSSVVSVGDSPPRPGAVPDKAARKAARKATRRAERRVTAKPPVIDLPAGGNATVRIIAKPRRAFIGTRSPYVVTVRCVDAADDVAAAFTASGLSTALPSTAFAASPSTSGRLPDVTAGLSAPDPDEPAPPLVTVTHADVARPRLARTTATVTGLLLVLALTGGAVWFGRTGKLGDLFDRLRRPGPGQQQVEDPVTRPFALVDVFQKDDPTGKSRAEAARERFNSSGMQVRVVDSTTSEELADGAAGLWVVMRDGFASAEAAQAYCRQYRVVAPGCQVVP